MFYNRSFGFRYPLYSISGSIKAKCFTTRVPVLDIPLYSISGSIKANCFTTGVSVLDIHCILYLGVLKLNVSQQEFLF